MWGGKRVQPSRAKPLITFINRPCLPLSFLQGHGCRQVGTVQVMGGPQWASLESGHKSVVPLATHDDCPLCRIRVSLRNVERDQQPKHAVFSLAFPASLGWLSTVQVSLAGWLPSASCLPWLPCFLHSPHKLPDLNLISQQAFSS